MAWENKSKSSSRPRPPGWKQLRLAVLDRDNHICKWCGSAADQVDHVVPVAEAGSDDMSNLAAACAPCNIHRGAVKGGRAAQRIMPRQRRRSERHSGLLDDDELKAKGLL